MLSWLASLELTPLSVWIRESPSLWAFPFILYLHTLGLAMLAGLSVGIDFWLLAVRARPLLATMAGLYRVMWLGFAVNAVSGLLLLLAYPAKALTNWVFFVKLLLIAIGVLLLELMRKDSFAAAGAAAQPVSVQTRRLAMLSLGCWAGAILAGRLLAYTHSILLASEGF